MAVHTVEYGGETYIFCCAGCKTTFEKDSARYVDTAVSSGTISVGDIAID